MGYLNLDKNNKVYKYKDSCLYIYYIINNLNRVLYLLFINRI